MIEWLKRLLHPHEWIIFRTGRVMRDDDCVGYYHDVQCRICGKLKRRKLT